jgi:hypothetical protein
MIIPSFSKISGEKVRKTLMDLSAIKQELAKWA